MTTPEITNLLGGFPEINPANYTDDDVNALNAWGIAAHTALETLQTENGRLKLALLSASEGTKDREHAEKYFREAEALLTGNERTLIAKNQGLQDIIAEVAGCFEAAMGEGLAEVLAETTDERLKDLVERRLMYALFAAQKTPQTPLPPPGFLLRTSQDYAAWCKSFFKEDALDANGMRSLDGLWAWQEQETRKLSLPHARDAVTWTPETGYVFAKPQAPYPNCRFKICDLPGQCKGEGKCHHPAVAQAQEGQGLKQFLSAARDAGITHWSDDLTDRLVAISAAVADSDDRAAQSLLRETIKLLNHHRATEPAPKHITVTDDMHRAAVKVLHRASGLDGLPQRMMNAMLAVAPEAQ